MKSDLFIRRGDLLVVRIIFTSITGIRIMAREIMMMRDTAFFIFGTCMIACFCQEREGKARVGELLKRIAF
jgi:hypothetical protein